jgi:RES domain-containing protein
MQVWRLCRRPHADLSGEGAKRFGGRWNSPGRPVVYTAEHPALAALEVRVHLDVPFELLPADYVLMGIVIPNALITDTFHPVDSTEAGDAWLADGKRPGLRVPSVLVPHAWNILLNPLNPTASQARIETIEPLGFDPRLWRPLDRAAWISSETRLHYAAPQIDES